MARKEPAEPDIITRALARNRLGVPSVVFFGVAGAAPLTVIIGAISTIYAIIGNTAVPRGLPGRGRHPVDLHGRASWR